MPEISIMKKRTDRFSAPLLLLLLLFLSVGASLAQSGNKGFSGEFDSLTLGVDGQNHLTGFYEDGTGENPQTGKPIFTCEFFIEGKFDGGKYRIQTYYPGDKKVIAGELSFSGDGEQTEVYIKLESEHGGCPNVSKFSGDGTTLMLSKRGEWTSIAVVSAAKTNFYAKPDAKTKRRAYLVKSNCVRVYEKRGNWSDVEYVGEKSVRGWIKNTDTYALRF